MYACRLRVKVPDRSAHGTRTPHPRWCTAWGAPAALWIGRYPGPSFPAGSATQAIAVYGMLAIVLAVGRLARRQAMVYVAAATITVAAGAASMYLAASWLTDVLAGWALGAMCIAVVLAADVLITTRDRRAATVSPRRSYPPSRMNGHRRQAA